MLQPQSNDVENQWKHSPSLTPENSLASGKCLQVGKSATITQDTLFSLAWGFCCGANLEENILSCHEKNCNPSIGPAYVHQKHKCCCGKPRNPLAPLPKKKHAPPMLCSLSQNYRITIWLRLAVMSRGHLVQPPAKAGPPTAGCPGPWPGRFKISKEWCGV